MVGWIEVAFPFVQMAAVFCVVLWFALAVVLYFTQARAVIASLYIRSSVVTGLYCWLLFFIVTYRTLGLLWLVVGLLLAGVGIIPLAFIGVVVHGYWWEMPQLLLALALVLAPRLFGAWLNGDFKKPARKLTLFDRHRYFR